MPLRTRRSLLPAITFALLALASIPAIAQTKAPANDGSVQLIEFGDDPVVIESVGLTVEIPVGASSEQTRVSDRASLKIFDAKRTWQVNIQTPRLEDPETTAKSALEELIINLMEQSGVVYDASSATGADVLDPDGTRRGEDAPSHSRPKLIGYRAATVEPLTTVSTLGGVEAQRIYIKLPAEGSKKNINFIRGYVVLKASESQLVSFEFISPESEFPRTRKVFEAMLAASSIADATLVNAQRQVAVEAGLKIFDALDQAKMEEIIKSAEERWERLYEPGKTGAATDDREIGYRRVRAKLGEGPIKSAGATRGYVVQIDARILLPNDIVCDSQGVYFMTPDRQRENWTVTNTMRDVNPIKEKRKKAATTREIGARDGNSLTVRTEREGGESTVVKPSIEGAGYISQVEAWLLPQILVRSGIVADFAFYSYRAEPQQILFRREDVKQMPDRPDIWTVTSKLGRAGSEQVSTLNSKGQVIRTRLGDNSVWEPVSFAQLKRLWEDKGLPTE